jgi:hypothetical protein
MRLGAEESGDEFPPELELILEAAAERLDGMIFADMVLTPSEIGMRMLTR